MGNKLSKGVAERERGKETASGRQRERGIKPEKRSD